ncbi:hypothetical protein CHS0354_014720 [Potamilus streckersoni]|uniref:C2H2-type domain-containing protein n=1 Tax=Potamilus streckersoni TaxID=2493646 RepID=A0AAE0VZT9_9BIVA|nr:hypothetical protein CHS0354_014720 [Potamilus streckersoni]
MDSYLILLYVTLEQENAIQSLFKQREWLYNKMKFTKTDNKDECDFASPWRRPDLSDNGSLESMVESSSFNQKSPTNNKRILKYTSFIQQISNSEYKDQNDNGMNGSDFTHLTQKIFSKIQGDEVDHDKFPFSTSLQTAFHGAQSDEFYEARVDNSVFHDESHTQTSFNCDKSVEEDHDQLSFEIQIKQEEDDDISSCQPETHADGSLPGISSEQPQMNVAPVMFLSPASIKEANNFLNYSTSHVSSHREKLRIISKKKGRVSDQNNGDKGTSEIQASSKTFKRLRKNSSLSQVTETGRRKGKCFKKKMKGKASKPYLADHNNECEKIILEKSQHQKHLLEIAEEKQQMESEQNVTGHTATGNTEKMESNSYKDCKNMTMENSSGSNESIAKTMEEKVVVDLEYNKAGLPENRKNAPTLAEFDTTALSTGKSKMEKGRIYCEDCKESFKLAGKFRRHKRDGKCVFHCEFCGKRYISKDYASFMVHKRYHMDDRPYKCQLCPKAYKFEYQLKVHFRSHAGERPWVCEICGARFLATFNLKQHKLNMHSDETHVCDICGASLRNKGYLEWHKKFVHSSERPFPCPTCGQHFKTKKTLKDHKLVHKKALDFICDICSKGFKTKTRLNYHVRRHQNDRRYQCETCGKRFYCTKTLGNHQMIHSGEKPFKCSVCDYRCTIKSNLGKHMKVHTSK